MEVKALEKWSDAAGSGPRSLLQHRFLKPPYGYVTGVILWPVFLSLISVWAMLLQSGLPAIVDTAGGLVIGVGGFVVTSITSALVMGITARNTPYERIRRQFGLLLLALPLAVVLFGLYLQWPTIPYDHELGLSVFAAHELSKIVFLGPTIGFAFVIFPLAVLAHRIHLK